MSNIFFRKKPPLTDLHKAWQKESTRGRNQVFQLFCRLVNGSGICEGSNFADCATVLCHCAPVKQILHFFLAKQLLVMSNICSR